MLEQTGKKYPSLRFGAKMLIVRGRRFKNSAAKFWSTLIDEILTDYAGSTSIILAAVHDGHLDASLLFPEIELERELNFLLENAADMSGVWQKALADFELYGPPGSVELRVYSPAGEQKRMALPMDCVDAELFLYLLAWLLEWADLPVSAWNDEKAKGFFEAFDPFRKFKYGFDFTVEHAPLKEGLFTWKVELKFNRHGIPADNIRARHDGIIGHPLPH